MPKNLSSGRDLYKIMHPNEPNLKLSNTRGKEEQHDPLEDSDSEMDHSDYVTTSIIESVALKQLHAAEDLNQLFTTCTGQLSIGLDNWNGGGRIVQDSSQNDRLNNMNYYNSKSFSSMMSELTLVLETLENNVKVSLWSAGQNEFVMTLLEPAITNHLKLVKKLERWLISFQNIIKTLHPILINYYMEVENDKKNDVEVGFLASTDDKYSASKMMSLSQEALDQKMSPSIFKIFRDSIFNMILCGKKGHDNKGTDAVSLKSLTITPEEDEESESNLANLGQTLEAKPYYEDDSKDVTASVTIDMFELNNSNYCIASTRIAVVNPDSYQEAEAGNGEAKQIVSEMNREALINRILAEADAKYFPKTTIIESAVETYQQAGGSRNENHFETANLQLTKNQNEIIEVGHPLSSLSAEAEPEEQCPSYNSDKLDDISSQQLLLILKCHAKDLQRKTYYTTTKLRQMEQRFYSLHTTTTNNNTNYTMKSAPNEVQEILHLVKILKEVEKLLADHPQVQNLLNKQIRLHLTHQLSNLYIHGHACCNKLEEFYEKVKADYLQLKDLVKFYQKSDLIVYEYSSNFGLNSFSKLNISLDN